MNKLDVTAAVISLCEALEAASIEYALSGAIALAYWTVPRATVDIDIAVNVAPAGIQHLLATLGAADCKIPADARAAAQRGDLGVRCHGVRVDLFLPVLAISHEAVARRVRMPFAQAQVWILRAEDLVIFKLLFGRTKDFADIERLLAAQRSALDYAYIDRQINATFEVGDERIQRYRVLVQIAQQ